MPFIAGRAWIELNKLKAPFFWGGRRIVLDRLITDAKSLPPNPQPQDPCQPCSNSPVYASKADYQAT